MYYCRVGLPFVQFAAYLAIAVLNNHEHWGVLALHGSVQRLNAHAMLCRAKSQRPWVPNGPWWQIPGKLWGEIIKKKEGWRRRRGKKEKGNETQKGHSHQCSITSAVTF